MHACDYIRMFVPWLFVIGHYTPGVVCTYHTIWYCTQSEPCNSHSMLYLIICWTAKCFWKHSHKQHILYSWNKNVQTMHWSWKVLKQDWFFSVAGTCFKGSSSSLASPMSELLALSLLLVVVVGSVAGQCPTRSQAASFFAAWECMRL